MVIYTHPVPLFVLSSVRSLNRVTPYVWGVRKERAYPYSSSFSSSSTSTSVARSSELGMGSMLSSSS